MKKKKLNLRDIKSNSETTHGSNDEHNHSGQSNNIKEYLPAILSFTILIVGIALDYFDVTFFKDWLKIIWYAIAYIPVGLPVIKEAFQTLKKKEIFASNYHFKFYNCKLNTY